MEVSIGDLKLSALKGLLGNVFPNLRSVCVNSIDNLIQVCFYYENSISDKEQEMCYRTISQMKTYFAKDSPDVKFETSILRIDYPKKMPLIGYWVFYRKEDSSQYID